MLPRLLAVLFASSLQMSVAISSGGRPQSAFMDVVGRSLETTTTTTGSSSSSSSLSGSWWVELAHEVSDCTDAPAFAAAVNDCAAIQHSYDTSSGCYQRDSQKNSSL